MGERGATSVEYALLVAVIVTLLVGGVVTLFDVVRERFSAPPPPAPQRPTEVRAVESSAMLG